MKMAPSAPTETIFSPSGVNFTLVMAPVSLPALKHAPSSYPQTFTPSPPPVTTISPLVEMSSELISALSDPSRTRIACASKVSHHAPADRCRR